MSRFQEPDEPKALHTCETCGDDICKYDTFAEIEDAYYCEYCLEELDFRGWLSLLGVTLQEAGVD